MMHRKIGFIGTGNMARAMISGIMKSGYARPDEVIASNRTDAKLLDLQEQFGIEIAGDNRTVAQKSDIIFLSATPDVYPLIIEEIRDVIDEDSIVILIAAGQTIAENESRIGRPVKMVKAMPNTPVDVRAGMISVSINELVTETDMLEIRALFECFGKVEFIDESQMDIASAVGGSSPAFGYVFIEALADSAVLYGMPRQKAYTIAAQALLGAAKMVLETDEHPGKLKDNVCSPGGTTIQSIAALEENGFRSAIMQAVKDNMKKMESYS